MNLKAATVVSLLVTVVGAFILWDGSEYRMPGNQQGYAPRQPVNFSHKLHAGANRIACTYCHGGAERSSVAGIPAASTCMNCHEQIRKDSPEIKKIAAALAANRPIEWVRIHRLPDHAVFDHSRHVRSGVDCSTCHGAVETMDRVEQVHDFTMGFCVNCHRSHQGVESPDTTGGALARPATLMASTDCSVCHH